MEKMESKENIKKSLREFLEDRFYEWSLEYLNKEWEDVRLEMEEYGDQIEAFLLYFLGFILHLINVQKENISEPVISHEEFEVWVWGSDRIPQWKESIFHEGIIHLPHLHSVIKDIVDRWMTEQDWDKMTKKSLRKLRSRLSN